MSQCQGRIRSRRSRGAQCTRQAYSDGGEYCHQHLPEVAEERQARKDALREAQERARHEEGLEALCEPVKGWVWCEGSEVVHYSSRPECLGDHRKLWAEKK